ncbi:hypothetical protein V1517DRAFT_312583 [Lipomyces orientalis]|uniref:Uncharacterized protein n=1 Tax=Lipomyces orientalis TaxID=1233043 RepID=A0ACC3TZC6_9ASCO
MVSILNARFSPRLFAIALVAFAAATFLMVVVPSSSVSNKSRNLQTPTLANPNQPASATGDPVENAAVTTGQTEVTAEDEEEADNFSSKIGSLLSWKPAAWTPKDDDEAEAEDTEPGPEPELAPEPVMPPQCNDPYRQPGFLHIPTTYELNVQWIPYFETDFLDIPDPSSARYPTDKPPKFTEGGPPGDVIRRSPHKWHKDLINYTQILRRIQKFAQEKDSDPFDLNDEQKDLISRSNWAHNRRVLVLGDSIDRFMVKFFCSDLGSKAEVTDHPEYGGQHTTLSCHIPILNFTIYHWHVASLYTYRPDWFWLPHIKYVAFEERFEKLFQPVWHEVIGLNGKSPDLILFQSGSWDERVFREAGRFEDGDLELPADQKKKKYDQLSKVGLGRGGRQLVWSELVFFKSRMEKFITFVRDRFGAETPLMYRSLTTRKESASMDLAGINMDRITRALATKHDIEIFEWARIAAAFSPAYMDYLHIGQGPLSYTWSNMLLYYLFRATGGVEYNGTVERFPDSVKQYVFDGEAVNGAPTIQVKKNPDTSVDKFWAECHKYNVHWGGR